MGLNVESYTKECFVAKPATPDPSQFTSWEELMKATHQSLYGAARPSMTPVECIESETALLKSAEYEFCRGNQCPVQGTSCAPK